MNGKEAEIDVVRDCLTNDINRGGENRLTIGQRFRDRGFKGGMVDEFRVYDRALTAVEMTSWRWGLRTRRSAIRGRRTGHGRLSTDDEIFDYYLGDGGRTVSAAD